MVRRWVVLAGWFGGLAGALVALHAAPLPSPDLRAPGTWSGWAAAQEPVEAAMAVLRLAGIGLGWYLVAATALGIVARLAGGARSVELADLVAVPFVRRVVHVGLGIGLVGAVTAAAGARGQVPVERGPTAAEVALTTDPEPFSEQPDRDDRPAYSENEGPRIWVIQPGDHLWSVAERVLAEQLGREPTEVEVHPYWQRLVEVNRPRLPVPANPDLVWAGLEIEVPSAG